MEARCIREQASPCRTSNSSSSTLQGFSLLVAFLLRDVEVRAASFETVKASLSWHAMRLQPKTLLHETW